MKDQKHAGYAIRDGILLHISDVQRGLACGCSCVVCGERLVAKKGSVRRHHFSHESESDCVGSAETALHIVAKEITSKLREIFLPEYRFSRSKKLKYGVVVTHERKITKPGIAKILSSAVEPPYGGFVPDVVLDCGKKSLIVEIAVTHKVDRLKLRRIRRANVPAIEICLESSDAFLSRAELTAKIAGDASLKRWLFHPGQRSAEGEFFEKVRSAIRAKSRAETRILPEFIASVGGQYSGSFSGYPRFSRSGIARLERRLKEFQEKFGRLPSLEESVRMFPEHFKKI